MSACEHLRVVREGITDECLASALIRAPLTASVIRVEYISGDQAPPAPQSLSCSPAGQLLRPAHIRALSDRVT